MSVGQSDKKMSVGVDIRSLANPNLRGFSRYTKEIVGALVTRPGLEVTGFTDLDVAHDVPIRIVKYGGAREILREQWSLPRVLAHGEIDVFLCPSNRGLPMGAPCPTVLTLHDTVEWDRDLVEVARGRSRLRFLYASAASLASSALVLTVSQFSADAIANRFGVPLSRIRVIHEAANSQFTSQSLPDDRHVRLELGLTRPYVLYVGGFDRKKDVRTLVRAFALLDEQIGVDLVLAGEITDDARGVIREIRELGIDDRTRLTGYVPDDSLPALYRGACCFVFPAIAEGFGLPVVEAMACGIPVVVAGAGSLPEVLGSGGQIAKPGDPHSFSAVLCGLLTDDAQRRRWADAAANRAKAFSWKQAAQLTEQALREATEESMAGVVGSRLLRVVPALARCAFA